MNIDSWIITYELFKLQELLFIQKKLLKKELSHSWMV